MYDPYRPPASRLLLGVRRLHHDRRTIIITGPGPGAVSSELGAAAAAAAVPQPTLATPLRDWAVNREHAQGACIPREVARWLRNRRRQHCAASRSPRSSRAAARRARRRRRGAGYAGGRLLPCNVGDSLLGRGRRRGAGVRVLAVRCQRLWGDAAHVDGPRRRRSAASRRRTAVRFSPGGLDLDSDRVLASVRHARAPRTSSSAILCCHF